MCDVNKDITFPSMPLYMSKSGIRKRDLFYPSLGCVTYSIAAVEEKQTLPRNSQLGCLL